MCGIAGILSTVDSPLPVLQEDIVRMTNSLEHRGPDDVGIWKDGGVGLALGHRRLSIIDLSQAGHQPMVSASGRYIIVFNGEVYNYLQLKEFVLQDCHDYPIQGHSDTEILVAAIEVWGLKKTLNKVKGMFALAVWDREQRKLYLARDRIGEKPLYYGKCNKVFMFASEIKAMMLHREWKGKLDRNSLALYMKYGFIPAPHSIFEDVYKVRPGHIVTILYDQRGRQAKYDEQAYWSLENVVQRAQKDLLPNDPVLIKELLGKSLCKSLRGQMQADVSLGAFLSGGIDSTTVVAHMQYLSDKPIKTFSIGFREDEFNEAHHASRIARHLGTDHNEFIVNYQDALDVVPAIAGIWDEPFADASQIPTYLVSKLARDSVKVCLSGDAGDELFGGYNRHLLGYRLWNRTNKLPDIGKDLLIWLIQNTPTNALQRLFRFLPSKLNFSELDYKVYKFARVLQSRDVQDFYKITLSYWDPQKILSDSEANNQNSYSIDSWLVKGLSNVEQMMIKDVQFYLADDILTKVDRASMSVSLETRLPYLDHDLIELAWRIPEGSKIAGSTGKLPLRHLLKKYVPDKLMERPKSGFSLPIKHWLNGPLHDWAMDLLEPKYITQQGILESEMVTEEWNAYRTGKSPSHYRIWLLLMFQNWYAQHEKYISV